MEKNSIKLSLAQREALEDLVRRGSRPANVIMHAQILLKSDRGPAGPGWSQRAIREAFGVAENTIRQVLSRYREHGMEDALHRRRQPPRPDKRKLDGRQEAQLVALLCQQSAQGEQGWSLRLIAQKVVELQIVESISHETIRQVLKKMN